MPGLIRGTYHGVTAGTGVGKTKWTKAVILHAYNYCKAEGIPLKILWIAREESVEKFWTSITSELLNQRFGTSISYYQIKGFHEGLTPEIQQQIDSLQEELSEMKKVIIVNDHTANPTGILYEVEKVLSTIGKFSYQDIGVDDNGVPIKEKIFTYDDPNQFFIVVGDHLGLFGLEPNNKQEPITTLHAAMAKWSKYSIDIICKKYKGIVINVHQQAMDGDNIEHRKAGLLVPTEGKLGGNKEIGRDYMYLWGLFKPWKYEMSEFLGYNVRKLKNHFITLHLIKHRDGDPDAVTPLWFSGVTTTFKELPLPNSPEMREYYEAAGD